ncbi:dipeptide ABC transporter ATP-binding protein [Taklimakanibacter deserti]|uniref:dipeptide ABC transporter ATP-binding protein n=1 Tax=Taklimakanibacter deserti TaxID=2267839 RepID=UPI000E651F4C
MTKYPLEVARLSVAYRQGNGWLRVVDDVSFAVAKGEVFGLVGESGCGKSTVALQLLGYRHPATRIEKGEVRLNGVNILSLPRPELDRLRGVDVSFVPQNPTTALNPGILIGEQIAEVLAAHGKFQGSHAAGKRVLKLLDLVGLPATDAFARRYPHQLSGGQQQRVCIAMALACDPGFVVLDEPTTGLDVTTQEQIVSLLVDLRARLGMSMLYVTHDLGLLAQIADRIGVMYAGRLVEIAPSDVLFADPRHPYTQGLIGSIPRIEDRSGTPAAPMRGLLERQALPPGCPFAPRCDHALEPCFATRQNLADESDGRSVACWRWREIPPRHAENVAALPPREARADALLAIRNLNIVYGKGAKQFQALHDISLSVAEGETFALVGESGSGKSTLARAIAGLVSPAKGEISLSGVALPPQVKDRSDDQRRRIQYIFQNPDASLNPRARIGSIVARVIEFFFRAERSAQAARVAEALGDVRLDQKYAGRFADQLSGGERQRVAIARALVAEPSLLLCDEILSALDVSVQANILALLQRLKAEHGITMLFISHDLAVVRMLADRVCVLFRGEIMEIGPRDQVFEAPFHPYTHSLLMAVPSPRKRRKPAALRRSLATVAQAGTACVYAGRCAWKKGAICETEAPPWRETAAGLRLRCHLTLDELASRAEWPQSDRNTVSRKAAS